MKQAVAICLSLLMSLSGISTNFVNADSGTGKEPITEIVTGSIIKMQAQMEDSLQSSEEDLEQEETEEIEETETKESEESETSEEMEETEETQTDAVEAENSAVESSAAVSISAPSAVLMEASTSTILYEKDAKKQLRPASITKIMTLICIFDALEEGKINLDDTVTVSEYAASMGGSQVYLESGEEQTVETLIKCIAVASANDACVAMAEYIWGSEQEFVNKMNERAEGLGMTDTYFVNCNGLDADGHLTSAYDVALMSRELITKYPEIHNYSTIWMENITHVTKKGSFEFGLTNTNKLIKQYQYATGLKTGSTSLAKYCVSATAQKDNVQLIAVIMAAPDYKVRFSDATTLLNYGFGKCSLFTDANEDALSNVPVMHGVEEEVPVAYESDFAYLDTEGQALTEVKKDIQLQESLEAPIEEGSLVGKAVYSLNDKEIGAVNIICTNSVRKATLKDYFWNAFHFYLI